MFHIHIIVFCYPVKDWLFLGGSAYSNSYIFSHNGLSSRYGSSFVFIIELCHGNSLASATWIPAFMNVSYCLWVCHYTFSLCFWPVLAPFSLLLLTPCDVIYLVWNNINGRFDCIFISSDRVYVHSLCFQDIFCIYICVTVAWMIGYNPVSGHRSLLALIRLSGPCCLELQSSWGGNTLSMATQANECYKNWSSID